MSFSSYTLFRSQFPPTQSSAALVDPVAELPPELVTHIFSFMGVRDLGRCAQVSTAWKFFATDKVTKRGRYAYARARERGLCMCVCVCVCV